METMQIRSIANNAYQQNGLNFQGTLKSRFLPMMLENFSKQEMAEYKKLVSKASKVADNRIFSILKGRKYDTSATGDFFEYYEFVEIHPETENTLAPLSRCIKESISQKISFIRLGHEEQCFPKACVDVILEPLRKIYEKNKM